MSASFDTLVVRSAGTGVRFEVRVIPRASRTAISGTRAGRLLVRVTAPPVDQAANEAVVELLALTLAVPKRAVSVVRGHAGRNKTVEVAGLQENDLVGRFTKNVK